MKLYLYHKKFSPTVYCDYKKSYIAICITKILTRKFGFRSLYTIHEAFIETGINIYPHPTLLEIHLYLKMCTLTHNFDPRERHYNQITFSDLLTLLEKNNGSSKN